MRVGVVGDNFREDRSFRIRIAKKSRALPPHIEGSYPNLAALKAIEDPNDAHYQINEGENGYLFQRHRRLGQYETIGTVVLEQAAA